MPSINELFEKFINNSCSEEELNILFDHFNDENKRQLLNDLISSNLDEKEGYHASKQILDNKALDRVDNFIQSNYGRQVSKKNYLKYAAIIIVGLVGGALLYKNLVTKPTNIPIQLVKNNIKPGSNKATLKLSTGELIILDKRTSNLPSQIKNPQEGLIAYDQISTQKESKIGELSTPAGGTYEIILSDGTKVKLNSLSRLRFPENFNSEERTVELIGEAYFEVAKLSKNGQKIPFIVKTKRQIIDVLGTKFNISCYNDDKNQTTTLISGSVNVSTSDRSVATTLIPGQQAVTTKVGKIIVNNVNTEPAIAWSSGNFMFEDDYLVDILKQMSRWYNVDIDYENVPNTRYNVLLSRRETLPTILKYLENSGNIKFSQNNNTIYAIKK